MAVVTINLIRLDTDDTPNPSLEFLQGANMDILAVRNTLREIEEDPAIVLEEGSPDLGGVIVKSEGNAAFSVSEFSPLTITVLSPYVMKFEAGAIAFQTSNGNLIGTFLDSPGAIVQINNTVGGVLLQSGVIATMLKLLLNEQSTDPDTGKTEILDDDDITPLLEADIFEDVLKTIPYRGRGIEVRTRWKDAPPP